MVLYWISQYTSEGVILTYSHSEQRVNRVKSFYSLEVTDLISVYLYCTRRQAERMKKERVAQSDPQIGRQMGREKERAVKRRREKISPSAQKRPPQMGPS